MCTIYVDSSSEPKILRNKAAKRKKKKKMFFLTAMEENGGRDCILRSSKCRFKRL